MDSAENYRDYAAKCLQLAQHAADAGDKARLLQMAQAWQALAEKREHELTAYRHEASQHR